MEQKFVIGERVKVISCTDRYIDKFENYIGKEFTIAIRMDEGTFINKENEEFHCPFYRLQEDPRMWAWPERDLELCEKPISITDEDYMTVFREME